MFFAIKCNSLKMLRTLPTLWTVFINRVPHCWIPKTGYSFKLKNLAQPPHETDVKAREEWYFSECEILFEKDINIQNRICVMALHHLCFTVPSKVSVKNTTWTPSIVESKDSFLNEVKNSSDMNKKLQSQNKLNQLKNIKEHPIIYEMKNSDGTIYTIVVGDSTYECTSLLEAVDVTFKIFVMLKIPFPPQSVKVWLFLNELFYKLTLDQKPNATMISVLDSFEM